MAWNRFSKGHQTIDDYGYNWVSDWQSNMIKSQISDGYIQPMRYKQKAISKLMPKLFDEYASLLENICTEMSIELTKELRNLIYERAYLKQPARYYFYGHGFFGTPTYQFAKAWECVCYVGKRGTLHFDIKYNYTDLDLWMSDNYGDYNAHSSTWGADKDMRLALADILNERRRYSRVKRAGRWNYGSEIRGSEGRWQEAFDKYCRTKGYQMFRKKCHERKIPTSICP